MDARRRVLLGSAVTLNGGDAAIALGAERFLAEVVDGPVHMTVLDSQAADAEGYRGSEFSYLPALHTTSPTPDGMGVGATLARTSYRLRKRFAPAALRPSSPARREVLEQLRSADLLAATGGTYLVDNCAWAARLEEYEVALRADVPVVFLTQSLGPRDLDNSTRRLGAVLSDSRAVLVRDPESLDAVVRIAPDANVQVVPDMAFALERLTVDGPVTETPSSHDPGLLARRTRRDQPRVGLSVRHWQHFSTTSTDDGMRRYLRAVAAVVEHLVLKLGARVEFTSTCQGIPNYRYDDARTEGLLVDLLDEEVRSNVEVDRTVRSTAATIGHLAEFDLLVSTRMHQVILGWIAGVPTIGVAYEPKTTALFARHGVDHLVHAIDSLEAGSVIAGVDDQLSSDLAGTAALARAERERDELREVAMSWVESTLLEGNNGLRRSTRQASRRPSGRR